MQNIANKSAKPELASRVLTGFEALHCCPPALLSPPAFLEGTFPPPVALYAGISGGTFVALIIIGCAHSTGCCLFTMLFFVQSQGSPCFSRTSPRRLRVTTSAPPAMRWGQSLATSPWHPDLVRAVWGRRERGRDGGMEGEKKENIPDTKELWLRRNH